MTAEICDEGIPAIGIDLCGGTHLAPAKEKLYRLLIGVGYLLTHNVPISPFDLAAILGLSHITSIW